VKRLTNREATKALKWAQARLGLQDWEIELTVREEPPGWIEQPTPHDRGCAEWLQQENKARIWVRPTPRVSNTNLDGVSDPLRTLFHECVHLWFKDTGLDLGETILSRPMEVATNRMASILAFAYRKGMK